MSPSAWLPPRTALHRPLLWTAIAMAALSLALAVLAVVAPNEITGRNGWFKPLKFSLSIALYTATLHIYAAIWTRGTIRAMFYGTVTRAWAKQHHRAWYRKMTGDNS